MPKPTIVIGLGGTGQWFLTFLKKELLEIGGGTMPFGVKLLAFDTTSQTTVKTGQAGHKDNEESVKAGSVQLIEGKEFIPIGENVSQLVTEIAAGKHSHLQWFPAKSFIAMLPPAAFNIKEGSGQIRQMGRLSMFRDLSTLQKSEIVSSLRAAIQDVQKIVSRDSQLEIVIVGSLAGGTGAGMLIDMAILTREQAARLVANNYVVRGFFVLPPTFAALGIGEGREILARSFAAWRELDRFMVVGERYGVCQINYHEQNKDLRIEVNHRAFDVSYMVDPARQSANSLDGVKAEEGLFPAIAQVISLIMDEKAGKAYTEFVTPNPAGKLAQLPRHPYYSAAGSYTIKVPVYYTQEKFSHQLALDVLKEFLAPELNDKQRVYRVSEVRNQEPTAAQPGWTSVRNFMVSSSFNIDGNKTPNTMFLPMVSGIREKNALHENAIVQQWARGGLTQGQSGVLVSLTNIGQEEESKLISRNINDELQIPIWHDVPPSRQAGDTPDQAFPRIRARVADVRAEHYGVDTAGGERIRGKYGKALEQAGNSQLDRYKKFLQAWTVNNLNGLNSDPRLARGGKIGYVRAFYDELVNTFSYFAEFLNKVRLVRNEELHLAVHTREAAEYALKIYEMERGKTCPFAFFDDFVHPVAHRAQHNYLQAVQCDIDVRKDDILLDILTETAGEMEKIARNTLVEIDNWITHLAVGDSNLDIEGLYPIAMQSLNNVNVDHEIDKRLGNASTIIGEYEYQPDTAYITDAIKSLHWEVFVNDKSLGVTCGVDIPAAKQDKDAKFMPFQRTGKKPEVYNLELIIQLTERPYIALCSKRPLAKEIVKAYPTFEQAMKGRKKNINGPNLTSVGPKDHHNLSIFQHDDLVPSTDFEIWKKCKDAYIAQATDPHRGISASELHIFPAEITACNYEAEMPFLLGQDYRILHPEVVALLEEKERFEMFFHAIALGMIEVDNTKEGPYWTFKLPDDREPLYITVPPSRFDGHNDDDIFDVINNFVMEGHDQRPTMRQARNVNWDKLREAILLKQREFGKEKTIIQYQEEINDPKRIINKIRECVVNCRSEMSETNLHYVIGQEYLDLADLATMIYIKTIKSFSF